MKQRLIGLFLILVGVWLAYECVIVPLNEAQAHASQVSSSLKGTIICPSAVVFGAIYLIFGQGAEEVFGTRGNPKPAAYVVAFIVIGFGLALYFWMRSELERMGYDFGNHI